MYANYSQYCGNMSSEKEGLVDVSVEIYNIDGEETFRELLKRYTIVVVDVWANFCMPCKKIAPVYQKLAEKYKTLIDNNEIYFLKDCIDDESLESVHKDSVVAVPTFYIYAYGKSKGEIIGPDLPLIEKILDEVLDKSQTTTMLNKREYQESVFSKYQQDGTLKINKNTFEEKNVGVL